MISSFFFRFLNIHSKIGNHQQNEEDSHPKEDFSQLPDHVLEKIFSNLDLSSPKQLANLEMVCKKFSRCIETHWEQFSCLYLVFVDPKIKVMLTNSPLPFPLYAVEDENVFTRLLHLQKFPVIEGIFQKCPITELSISFESFGFSEILKWTHSIYEKVLAFMDTIYRILSDSSVQKGFCRWCP